MHEGLANQLDDAALRDLFGVATFLRGSSYAHGGRVIELFVDESAQTVSGTVLGSNGRRYQTIVRLDTDELEPDLESYCTCPVGVDCKHAAALLLAAHGRAAGQPPPARAPADWERSLTSLVGQSDDPAVPMALQFEVVTRPHGSAPYIFSGPSSVPARRIRLRPLIPGATGAWVRTGVSWRDLRFAAGHPGFDRDHSAAMRELLIAAEAGSRSPYGTFAGDAVFADELGPSLWRLLRQAVDCGVLLVSATKKGPPVVLSAESAQLSLDLRADAAQDGATASLRLLLGQQALKPAAVDQLGSPAHGIAVHTADRLLLAPLDRPITPQLNQLLRTGGALQIPSHDLDRFLTDYYPRLRRLVEVGSADDSVRLPEIEPPRLSLTLTYRDGHRLGLEWGFDYRIGDTTHTYPVTSSDPEGARDPAAERQLAQDVQLPDGVLPHLRSDVSGARRFVSPLIVTGMDAVRFLDRVLPQLDEDPSIVVHERGERPAFRPAESAPEVRLRATDSDAADWFDLNVAVEVDSEEVPFDALFTALARGDDHLLMPSGTWFSLDRPELEQLHRLIEEARSLLEADDGQLRLSRYQAGFWAELCQLGVVAEQSERWATSVRGLVDVDGLDPAPLPSGLAAELRPYQVDGYRWLSFLWEQGLGGILADDMGLGKTVQTLALLCRAKEAQQLDAPVLVVAPTSVVRNWATEASRFAPDLRVATVSETQSRRGVPLSEVAAEADVVVTSYSLFRIEFDCYARLPWAGLVLDEAQFVKNHQAKTYQCARRLGARFKLAITGTPLENNLMELWALLSIVAPGLFPSPQKFSEFYRRPIERGTDPALLTSLRRRIGPLMRRRTKEQVAADLPPKQEQMLEVELTPRHRRIYDTQLQRERQKILGLLDDLDKHRFTILKSLTLLRQLSLDPALVDDKHDGVTAAKVEVLIEQLTELTAEGHRALVFSQFTGFLRRVRERLDAEGIPYCYLDGHTRKRENVIAAFKGGAAPVFLISLKAGGFGLNLTEADYCFVLDPWWNPATEAQAVDRTHRIGQDKQVMVYRLVSSDTIEEKVMALKARKAELFRSVLADDGALSGPLTADDIKALLE